MASDIKVKHKELKEKSFFDKAFSLLEKAETDELKYGNISSEKVSGETAIQAFIGHGDIINSAVTSNIDGNIYDLFSNTKTFLNEMGVTFKEIDENLAQKIEEKGK